MGTRTSEEAAAAAWRSVMTLAGWGPGRQPRIPAVAQQFGLSPKQLVLLWRLPPGSTMSMRAMGDRLSCDASFMTNMVDRLEEDDLIERRPDPEDRRVTLIALTEKGDGVRNDALAALLEPPPEFAALDPDEVEQLAALLAKATAAEPSAVPGS
ncbi:MAG: MarR family transcriptional regulator [Solirubrobacterales bacterium]|nr:MarR family transcriptional regulator [Solirubrobacterales bacterium]